MKSCPTKPSKTGNYTDMPLKQKKKVVNKAMDIAIKEQREVMTKPSKERHWWLKKDKFKRVRLSTLHRLSFLYTAETNKSVADFMLWLDKYVEMEGYEH